MNLLTVNYESGELIAVPAVHFSHVFAGEVNRLCADPETRPEAVAVELGPQSATALKSWLKQLCTEREGPNPLPVMLGLTQVNRMIRPSDRDKALRLQHETGKDLSELPSEVLYEEFGYAGASLLCLCPTDSIVEAARCAVELNLPLYGVDLEETACGKFTEVKVQDPLSANGDLPGYVARNAAYAEQQRDEEIDSRREIAMAARLKTFLTRHRRVLFTCGLAHWLTSRPCSPTPPSGRRWSPRRARYRGGHVRKVVVHPLLAVRHMDIFPSLTVAYERHRRPVNAA